MSSAELRPMIEAASRRFEANFAAGDLDALVSDYYCDDPLVVGEGVGTFPGRDGARTYFTGALEAFGGCRLTPRRIETAGDLAFETGEVELTPRDAGQQPAVLSYFVSWVKTAQDGWKVKVDYFVPGPLGS